MTIINNENSGDKHSYSLLDEHRQLISDFLDRRKDLRRQYIEFLSSIDEIWAKLPPDCERNDKLAYLQKVTDKFISEIQISQSVLQHLYDDILMDIKSTDSLQKDKYIGECENKIEELSNEVSQLKYYNENYKTKIAKHIDDKIWIRNILDGATVKKKLLRTEERYIELTSSQLEQIKSLLDTQ
jgi:predicted transcriptional regulator